MGTARKRVLVAPEASKGLKATSLGDGPASTAPKDHNTPATKRALARVDARQDLITIADKVAGEPLYFRNYKFPGANKAYPDDIDAHMRYVTKYYPYTDAGKPLFIDEPQTEREILQCYEKQKVIRKLGFRHLVIEPSRTNTDGKFMDGSTLSDCLEQLGE